jgi:hypothetical protein
LPHAAYRYDYFLRTATKKSRKRGKAYRDALCVKVEAKRDAVVEGGEPSGVKQFVIGIVTAIGALP